MMRIAVVILWCLLGVCCPGLVRAETVAIATGELPPWTSESAKYGGFVNRVIKAAFARKGLDVKFTYMPWKRAETETKVGRYDASAFWFASRASERDFVLSAPISNHKEVFFHLKSTPFPHWETLSDLRGLKLGATLGYTYTSEFWTMAQTGKLKVEVAARDVLNLKKVAVGRIDAFPVDEVTGWLLLSNTEYFLPGIKDLFTTGSRPLRATAGYLRFPRQQPRTPDLVAKFNAGLLELRNDGSYDRYFQDMISGVY
jgi:polar amino acid transport system substrate-binding protein